VSDQAGGEAEEEDPVDKFFQDVGFEIADNWTGAVLIAGALVCVGLVLVVSGLRAHRDGDAPEYRMLSMLVGVVLAIGAVASLPLLKGEAEDACDVWSRSPTAADELRYLEHECDTLF
jgi:hypothetical protein